MSQLRKIRRIMARIASDTFQERNLRAIGYRDAHPLAFADGINCAEETRKLRNAIKRARKEAR